MSSNSFDPPASTLKIKLVDHFFYVNGLRFAGKLISDDCVAISEHAPELLRLQTFQQALAERRATKPFTEVSVLTLRGGGFSTTAEST